MRIAKTFAVFFVAATLQAQALQLVGLVSLSAVAIPASSFWGSSYSASKNSGTFPDAVQAGDKTIRDAKRVIGVKLHRELVVGARAEAQTFLANNEGVENLNAHYPMLSAAVDEVSRQGSAEGMIVNPYSVAEAIANFAE